MKREHGHAAPGHGPRSWLQQQQELHRHYTLTHGDDDGYQSQKAARQPQSKMQSCILGIRSKQWAEENKQLSLTNNPGLELPHLIKGLHQTQIMPKSTFNFDKQPQRTVVCGRQVGEVGSKDGVCAVRWGSCVRWGSENGPCRAAWWVRLEGTAWARWGRGRKVKIFGGGFSFNFSQKALGVEALLRRAQADWRGA